MERLNRVLGYAYLSMLWIIREPIWLLNGFVWILGFYMVFLFWGGSEALVNYTVVVVTAGYWGIGVNVGGQEYGWNKVTRLEEFYIAGPASFGDYFIGITLGMALNSLIYSAPILLLASQIGVLHLMPIVILLGIYMVFIGTATSVVIISRVKNPMNVSALTNTLSTVLSLVPPLYYPATALPSPLDALSSILPHVAATEYVRSMVGMGSALPPIYNVLIMAVWGVALLILIHRYVTWGWE